MRAILAVLLLLSAAPLRAAPLEILDREGFSAPLVALRFELPEGWQGEGRVTWIKPCSGSDTYETIYTIQSADGSRGARLLPSHKLLWGDVRAIPPEAGMPSMAAQMAAQVQADRARLEAETRGTNCHVTPVADTPSLVQGLILAGRPAGTETVGIQRAEDSWRVLRDLSAQTGTVPGMRTMFDAVEVALRVPTPQGPRREVVQLSWSGFEAEIVAPMGYAQITREIYTQPLLTVWAPEAEFDAALAQIGAILATATPGVEWSREMDKVRAQQEKERQRAFAQSQADAQVRREQQEAQHRQFMEMITQ